MTVPGLTKRVMWRVRQGLRRLTTLQLKQRLTLVRTGLGEGRPGDFCTKKESDVRAEQVDQGGPKKNGANLFRKYLSLSTATILSNPCTAS